MLEEIRSLLRLLHITDFESSVALAACPPGCECESRHLSRRTGPGKALVTNIVTFKTERELNTLELLKAVHTIKQQSQSSTNYQIPLEYDPVIPVLMSAVQRLHRNFESLIRIKDDDTAAREYNLLTNDLQWTSRLHLELPVKLGLAAAHLSEPALGFSDLNITRACRWYVELEVASLISRLAKWQLLDGKAVMTDYAGLDQNDIVAKVAGEPTENLVSYRFLLTGDVRERIVLAPRDYGREQLLIQKEFRSGDRMGKPYTPANSFLVEYLFPQMFWNSAPAEWNMDRYVQSVFVKNLEGKYL